MEWLKTSPRMATIKQNFPLPSTQSSSSLLLPLVLLLCLALPPSLAQQSALYTTPTNDFSESHRQSVCDRQAQLHNGSLELRNALAGLQIRPLLLSGDIASFLLPPNTTTIPETNPGIVVELLDELATRAGFTWRNSFGIVDTAQLASLSATFDDMLQWSVRTYDVSATLWTQSVQRLSQGSAFPEGFYDASIILVGEVDTAGSKLNVWSFLEPFSPGVWIMIAVTLVVSGLIYWWMERYNEDSDRQDLGKIPTEPVFLAALSFTGEVSFQPSTDYARLFVLSLAFFCLLIGSAYTANLASFLVVQNSPSFRIEGVEGAVQAGLSMCVLKGTVPHTIVTQRHPGARLVEITTSEADVFLGVRGGLCDLAVTSVGSWDRYRGQRLVNADCNLAWVGRVFEFLHAGFATRSDSGTLCTNLIRDALSVHLLEMKQDGFLENALARELEFTWDMNCDLGQNEGGGSDDDSSSSQLGLQDTGGLFIVHYGVAFVAVLMAICNKRGTFRRLQRRLTGREQDPQLRAVNGMKESAALDGAGTSMVTSSSASMAKSASQGTSANFGVLPSQQHLELMYARQSEQLTALSEEMSAMLAKLTSVQEESKRMGDMIRGSPPNA